MPPYVRGGVNIPSVRCSSSLLGCSCCLVSGGGGGEGARVCRVAERPDWYG